MRVYFAGPLFTPYERGFIDECAARLRAEDFEVFVPHEHALAEGDETPAAIFAKDWQGLEAADAVLALLDGPSVDDGTACEIGLFHGLMQADPSRRGIVGLLTDMRGTRGGGHRLNLFLHGCIEGSGSRVVGTLDEAVAELRRLRADGR
jgi:Nucleoside 2-deoxyribosyltransferase